MTCISISRQMGSLGCEVANQLGDILGYRVVWRDLINQAALRAQAPEMALATIDELDLFGMRPSLEMRIAYCHAVEQVMYELAEQGNVVIVGRAGQVILKDRPDALRVRIIAPSQLRAERIARKENLPIAAAMNQIEASDRNRRKYLRLNYQVRWDDPELYDLIINTAHYSAEAAARLIVQALDALMGG
ncbi:MAG TPA: cytidylate kinase-like family protein [Anaerolineaceae bacterium]|nr:cytidylate kinase-like family protein [Anaerolineaceae bacterium]